MIKLSEYIRDYDEVDYLNNPEKKAMADKYHSSPKIKDIKHSILLAMREERKLRKNYTDEDVAYFSRLDFPDRDLEKYLGKESIEFVRYLANFYLEKLKKSKVDKYVGSKSLSGLSPSQKYLIKKYMCILNYLNINDKSEEEKLRDKNAHEHNMLMMKNLISKLDENLSEFKKKLIKMAVEYAKKAYESAPKLIDAYNKQIEEINNEINSISINKSFELHELYKKKELIRKKINKKQALLDTYKTFSEYKKKCEEETINQYNSNVSAIAERVKEYGLNIDNVECKNIDFDPKFIEMMITDGIKKLYCRSVLAAEYSVKMIPHFRFIITNRK